MKCHCCEGEYKPQDKDFVYRECSVCRHRFRPYKDSIGFHTTEYRTKTTSHRVKNEFDADRKVLPAFHESRRWISKSRVDKVRDFVYNEDKLLDVGSGGGSFASHVALLVDTVHCLDLDPSLTDESTRLGFTTWNADFLAADVDSHYDVVTNWHVLEHTDDPIEILWKVYSLNPRVFFCEVPTNRPLPAVFCGHVHMFTRMSMEALFTRVFNEVTGYSFTITEGIQKPAITATVKRL